MQNLLVLVSLNMIFKNLTPYFVIEQQTEIDAAIVHYIHRGLPLARLLGAPLVGRRRWQTPGRPSQLRHPLLLHQLPSQACRAWNSCNCESRRFEECPSRPLEKVSTEPKMKESSNEVKRTLLLSSSPNCNNYKLYVAKGAFNFQ